MKTYKNYQVITALQRVGKYQGWYAPHIWDEHGKKTVLAPEPSEEEAELLAMNFINECTA